MVHSQFLKVNGVDMNKMDLANGSTTWTDPVDTHLSKGNAALQVEVHSGDIAINFQTSLGLDKKFFDLIDINDNDLTEINASVTDDKWIVYDTMLARAQRFKIVAAAASNVSIRYVQQEY